MASFLFAAHRILWGAPTILLILGMGVYLSFLTRFVQLRMFPQAMHRFWKSVLTGLQKESSDGITSFQSLCTALAATVGTGNLIGVAGAICLGGPGAVFWIWVCGLFGMATKYAEAVMAIRYRAYQGKIVVGGPMYFISLGMGKNWSFLAQLYCLFGVFASFGIGNMVQVSAIVSSTNHILSNLGRRPSYFSALVIGCCLALAIGFSLQGGARRIASLSESLVPFASFGYIALCITLLICRYSSIPTVIRSILSGAFSPKAVTGGMLGSAFPALRYGCSRGVFTNEAGLGTAAISHAAADVSHPAEQGMMGIVEVFLDTIVICTLTALAILCSGISVPYGADMGSTLTSSAFAAVFGDWVCIVLACFIICFAFATILGWGMYGIRCFQFLAGQQCNGLFILLQMAAVLLGAVGNAPFIWQFSEIMNALMAYPNLIALAALQSELVRLTMDYKSTR